jgi:hypothetical protein
LKFSLIEEDERADEREVRNSIVAATLEVVTAVIQSLP